MKTYLDCIPCFVRQTLESTRLISEDPALQERVLRSVLQIIAQMDLQQSPPAMGAEIHRIIRQASGEEDPYREIKQQFNQFLIDLLPRLRDLLAQAEDPFETAIRLAAAGNVIDFGVYADLKVEDVWRAVEWGLAADLDLEMLEALRAEVPQARSILYLADNAGEIICDRLLIELLPLEKVTLVVRASPVINDVTRQDAEAAGLTEMVRVMDNGSDAPGTILHQCSSVFRREFETADLVIAKGQGNYESLNDTARRVYFIFKAKCPVAARSASCSVGDLVLTRS